MFEVETWADVWAWWSLSSTLLALLTIPSVLLRRRGRPLAAMAWVLALIGAPVIGLLCWWLFGRRHLDRKRSRRQAAQAELSGDLDALAADLKDAPVVDSRLQLFKGLAESADFGVFAPVGKNQARLLVDGHAFFPALEEAIREAKCHIHLLFYIWQNDVVGRELLELLASRARAGVEVRLLYDSIGSSVMDKRVLKPLLEAGGQAAACSPVRIFSFTPTINFRNHRKIAVIDGEVAFTGGINVGKAFYHDWHDHGLRVEGPVVDQFQQVFADDWYFATHENLTDPRYFGQWREVMADGLAEGEHAANCAVVASGPHQELRVLRDALFVTITTAQTRVWIMTPYFIPDPATLVALRTAVYRGVDVRVMVPGQNDVLIVKLASRSYYEELMGAGVRIYEYEPSVLHSKVLIFDDDLAVLGTANMDARSFRLNFEVSCFIESEGFNAELRAGFEADLAKCREMGPEDIDEGKPIERVLEAFANLASPLL